MNLKKIVNAVAGCVVVVVMTACNGIFDDIYDKPSETVVTREGQIAIDASSWTDWYYIDFDSLADLAAAGDSAGLEKMQTQFTAYPVPTELTGEPVDSVTGVYTYWFDVFGEGLDNYERRDFTPTDAQPEPQHWSIGIHMGKVRTNGGAVLKTNYTSMDDLPESSTQFTGATFTPDEWSEKDVWVVRARMLQSLIGCQGIKINPVLSGWFTINIPPMPPTYSMDSHVYLIRFPNGKIAAVQMENHIRNVNGNNNNYFLTINYKYPY